MPTDLEQELYERRLVVDRARSWIGTPYHHGAAVKGHGVDCARILAEVFHEAGLVEKIEPGFYTRDWHLHRGEEHYLSRIEDYCKRVDSSEASLNDRLDCVKDWVVHPGNILIWRIGRTFSHAAIVTKWERAVHASFPSRCVEEFNLIGSVVQDRPMRVYSYWGY